MVTDVVVQDEGSNGNISTLSISVVTQTSYIQTINLSAWRGANNSHCIFY